VAKSSQQTMSHFPTHFLGLSHLEQLEQRNLQFAKIRKAQSDQTAIPRHQSPIVLNNDTFVFICPLNSIHLTVVILSQ